MIMADKLRFDPQAFQSMLWKFDAAVEQVDKIESENAVVDSAQAFVGGGLEGKAQRAGEGVRKGQANYLERLGNYKQDLLDARARILATDVEEDSRFKHLPNEHKKSSPPRNKMGKVWHGNTIV